MATKSQMENARLGAIGELNVQSILMQHGWDAFNANDAVQNFKSIDIVCLKSAQNTDGEDLGKPDVALVQVKTTEKKDPLVGLTIKV